MATRYWTRLTDSSSTVRCEIDRLLDHFGVRPVGHGYIDIIVPPPHAQNFMAAITDLGVAVHVVTLWCAASERNQQQFGCPHGLGGPVHDGVWYSEMCEQHPFDAKDHGIDVADSMLEPFSLAQECNALAWSYVSAGIKKRLDYSPCFTPGLWLAVPDDWRSTLQATVA